MDYPFHGLNRRYLMLQDVAGKRLLRISHHIPMIFPLNTMMSHFESPLNESPFYKWYLVSTATSPVAHGGLVLVSCRNPHVRCKLPGTDSPKVSTRFDHPLILVSRFRRFVARLVPIRGRFSVAPNKTKLFNVILYALGIQFQIPYRFHDFHARSRI